MLPNRSLNVVAPLEWEANEVQPASSVYAEVMRKGVRDVGIVGGEMGLSLSTTDPVLYPGVLAGATPKQVSGGIAVFDGVSIDVPGQYTLTAGCRNDELKETPTSPTSVSITLWRIYGVPFTPTTAHLGYWINIVGSGVTNGIWAKIVDFGNDVALGDYFVLEQPTGATSLSTLVGFSGVVSVKYNAIAPLAEPNSYLMVATTAWFAWNPDGGEDGDLVDFFVLEATDETLSEDLDIEVLRHVSVHITSAPTTAMAGQTYALLAVLRNQNGTTAVDLNSPNVTLEIRDPDPTVPPVYSASVPVVNGNVFKTVAMPLVAKSYTIWIQYQGTWYQADATTDTKDVLVVEDTTEPEEPGPTPIVGQFPPKIFELQAGGCDLEFKQTCYLELGVSTFIEVLTK